MNKLTVTTTIQAPLGVVWQKYTQPEHITKWSYASDDWECTSATNDLRVGGTFSNHLSAKDKSAKFDFAGTYTEVVSEKIIKYTMTDGRNAEVVFNAGDGSATTVTVSFDPETENPEEQQRQGWQAFLDNFNKYVESGK